MARVSGTRLSLAELAPWLQQLGDDIDIGIAKRMAQTAHAIHRQLYSTTPVRTGHARSNWVVTLDTPATFTAPNPGSFGQGISMQAMVKTSLVAPSSRAIYIVNNVPYITLLNQGSSRQAPAGFVEAAISHGIAATRGMRIINVS